jgi:serine/threonine-protein kinase
MTDPSTRLTAALADRYRIERELGQGGMATVYLAADLKHDRKVALKVLRPELAAVLGADRFVVEIKTTASLQHPHILPLFDSGTADGFLYYVMPYIEGETLRGKLNRETQLGIDEAVRITTQVADALDYAHRQGVIHRDIKPENILLHDGRPMVADFGIALALSAAAGGRMTETGLSLGTPHYMSPEQATAQKEITGRSDIYSLGSVLYEMLTGSPPHVGSSAQQIIMKIVTEDAAPVTKLRKAVPPNVAAAVAKALEKLPADRFESAKAFAAALADSHFTTATAATQSPRGSHRAARPAAVAGLAVAALAVGVAAGWSIRGHPAAATGPLRFYLYSDSARAIGENFAISPDGTTLVYRARTPAGPMLFEQRLSELEPRPIAGTSDVDEFARGIFFSPDGGTIGFATGSAIKRVRLDGSELATVTSITEGIAGAAWGADGSIIFGTFAGRLYRVASQGGSPTPMAVRGDSGTPRFLVSPQFLPGGRDLLCVTFTRSGARWIGVLTLASGEFRPLTAGISPVYLPPGNLVFVTVDGSVMIQPFDAGRRDTTGPAVRLLENVSTFFDAIAAYDVAAAGSLVYLPRRTGGAMLQLIERDGTARGLSSGNRFWVPRFSRDGRRIAYGAYGGSTSWADLWSYDLTLGVDQRLTSGGQAGRDYNDPVWSRDGSRIALSALDSLRSGKNLYLMASDATDPPELLLDRPGDQWPSDWTPDGKYLLFTDTPTGAARSIWLVPTSGAAAPRPVVHTGYNATGGRLSPDGRWLAYDSDETGQSEVYVQPFPGPGLRVRVSLAGGQMPVWSRGGRELFYMARSHVLAVEVNPDAGLAVGARDTLFEARHIQGGVLAQYDVHPDGRRFVVSTRAESSDRLALITSLPVGSKR